MVREKTTNWDLVVSKCVSAYNGTIHASTGFTPNKLWLGREIYHSTDLMFPKGADQENMTREEYVRLWEDDMRLAYETARDRIGRNIKIQKKYYDKNSHLVKYKEGDAVLIKDFTPKIRGEKKLADRWAGPYFILDVLSDVNFRIIKNPDDKPKIVHHDRLKRYHQRDLPDVSWVLKRSKSFNSSSRNTPSEVTPETSKPLNEQSERTDQPASVVEPPKAQLKRRGRPVKKVSGGKKLKHSGGDNIKKHPVGAQLPLTGGKGRKTKAVKQSEATVATPQPPKRRSKRLKAESPLATATTERSSEQLGTDV